MRRMIAFVTLVGLVLGSWAAAADDPNLRSALAYVDGQCPKTTRFISTSDWMTGSKFNALYGNCLAGDGINQRIWFFSSGRYLGSDTQEPDSSREIIGLWRTGDTLAFMYVVYRRLDPDCCPTGGGKIVRFRLEGGRVVRLDPLPNNR